MYKEIWRPIVEQQLPVFTETDNIHDRRAVAVHVYKDGSVVGHVPRELSRVFSKHDGKVECEITRRREREKELKL